MADMLWQLNVPFAIAKAKEDMGMNNIWKYIRYYRMFMERFKWTIGNEDMSRRIENLLFWRGQVAFVNDIVYGLVVCEIDDKSIKVDPNGKILRVSVSGENNYKRKNLEVGKDVVILYSDSSKIPPVLYVWAIANEIIEREDIIKQQDNMLRKPIMVTGEGEDFDNAINKVMNVLSGVAWFNTKPKGKSDIMSDKGMEVLNLQVGNSYKGAELWESRKHYEELICDYLGYTTSKNEKRERMNTLEVSHENSVCEVFYKTSVNLREMCEKQIKEVLGVDIKLEKVLENETEEDVNYGNNENNVGRVSID